MKWGGALGLLLACALLGARTTQAGPSDARVALRELVGGVEARRGIQHRSLVVVALVSREACEDQGPAQATAGLTWESHAALVAVSGVDVAEDRLLPTGTLLGEGPRERVLAYPAAVGKGAVAEVEAVRVPFHVPVPRGAARSFAGLAGPEARHVVTIAPHADALGELLTLERLLAGLPDGDVRNPLLAIRAAPRVAPARAGGAKALGRLTTAYGGEVRGMVAFLGHRPVEIVVAASAAQHAGFLRVAADGMATYLTLWEELYGRTDEAVDAVAWPRAIEVATRLLADLQQAGVRKSGDERRWRLRAKGASRLGWLLLDEDDRAVWLEAWPLGDAGPFPVPAREPGGKPIDERPDSILQGAMTREFLKRFNERLDRIRRGLGLR